MVGDNIYRTDPQSRKWLQENSVHSQPNGEQDLPNTEHDTQTDRVLISEEFFYFGENAPAVPSKLLEKIGYRNGRGHRVYEKEDCQRLLDWIKAKAGQQINRVLGDPFQFRMSEKRYSRTRNRLI
jgi:Nucleotide modification associated domain 2